jgi:hypothetical protein
MKCILIREGHVKVRWLAALARRDEKVAEDLNLLPAHFPKFKQVQDLAAALGATPQEFANWFPTDPAKRSEQSNAQVDRPRVEVARNIAKTFGFAPACGEDVVWLDWWAKHWSSFMPSEDNETNYRQEKTTAEDFKAHYREALKNGRLTFPPILPLATLPSEEVPGGIVVLPAPIAYEQARTETPKQESPETGAQTSPWRQPRERWLVFLISAVILVGCGYAIEKLWKHMYYPTVDLLRTIDFSELACDANGNKHDVAYLYDDYTIVRNLSLKETYVKVADLRGNNFSVDVYDLNFNPSSKIVAIHSDTNHERRLQSYPLAVRNSHVRAKWIWRNAHSQPDEGIAVTGGWILRNLTVNYTLPTGREVTTIREITPSVAARNCEFRANSIYCPGLYTRDEVQIWWDWTIWDGCEKK